MIYDEILNQMYLEVKGFGIVNQCLIIVGGFDKFGFKVGNYIMKKLCMELIFFIVKVEFLFKGGSEGFQNIKLMICLMYILDEIEGFLMISGDGKLKFEEKDGIDYVVVMVQFLGGERVLFLFMVKELVVEGIFVLFGGLYLVLLYRGLLFLDFKGRGGFMGYDNVVVLFVGGVGDEEELVKENMKNIVVLIGNIMFSIVKFDFLIGEIVGMFESVQFFDIDLGLKVLKEVKIEGIFYVQVEQMEEVFFLDYLLVLMFICQLGFFFVMYFFNVFFNM